MKKTEVFGWVTFGLLLTGLAGCGQDAYVGSSTDQATADVIDTGTPTNPTPNGTPQLSPISLESGKTSEALIGDEDYGKYIRNASVTVLDHDGSPAADGVQVYLSVIDSIVAQGQVDAAGNTLTIASTGTVTDTAPMYGGGITPFETANDFTSARLLRQSALFSLNDETPYYLVLRYAETFDQFRTLTTGSATATGFSVTSPFSQSYPGGEYTTAAYQTEFYVGASLLGATVAGIDAQGTKTAGITAVKGGDGNASFQIAYPTSLINAGCNEGSPSLDVRFSPLGSSYRMFVIAYVDGYPQAASINEDFCFSAIAGGEILLGIDSISVPAGGTVTGSFSITVIDGGDGVVVPYTGVGVTASNTALITVAGAAPTTDRFGNLVINYTVGPGASGDNGDITIIAFGLKATVSVKVL